MIIRGTETREIDVEVDLKKIVALLTWDLRVAYKLTEIDLISDGTHPESKTKHQRNKVPVGNMVEIQHVDWYEHHWQNHLNYMDRGVPTPEQIKTIELIDYLNLFAQARRMESYNEGMTFADAWIKVNSIRMAKS